MQTPAPASSLWRRTVVARGSRGRELLEIQREAHTAAEKRRDRVLACPWAHRRLCDILDLRAATQWNGFMPPRALPADDRGDQRAKPNDSPIRKALLQLLRDVEHFEQTGELPQEPAEVEQLAIT